jgi:hypothetical protein
MPAYARNPADDFGANRANSTPNKNNSLDVPQASRLGYVWPF